MSEIHLEDIDKEHPMCSTQERIPLDRKKSNVGPDGFPVKFSSKEDILETPYYDDGGEEEEKKETKSVSDKAPDEVKPKTLGSFSTIMRKYH